MYYQYMYIFFYKAIIMDILTSLIDGENLHLET